MIKQLVTNYIENELGAAAEHLWADYPDFAVFRNKRNQKWFAITMNIDRSKLGLKGEGGVDIINLKCDPLLIGSLLHNKGYLPAYHMNKVHWITLLLDGSVDITEIYDLINLSYEMIDKGHIKKQARREGKY